MTATYTIHVDPVASLVAITVAGFFGDAAFARFTADRLEAYRQLRCAPNQHVTLCDVSDCLLQAQDRVAGFQRMMADPRLRSRRMAFVVGSSIARMQVRRIVRDRDDVRTFTDRAEAEAWLSEPEVPVRRQAISGAGLRA